MSDESTRSFKKIWRAGTLTYTTTSLAVLFGWLLWGDFAWWMKERAVVPVGQLMLRQFGATDFLVGLLIGSVPAALGLFIAPIASVKSDHHRGRWGRRIPFLLIPTPFIVFAMFGMAGTAPLADWLHRILGSGSPGVVGCRLMVFGFFWTFFEIFQTIAQAVLGGLINDVVPTEVIGRFYGLFRAVSLCAAMIFNFWLIGYAEEHYVAIFVGLGLLFGAGFSLMCIMVKEGEYPPPPVHAGRVTMAGRFYDPVRIYVRECYSHPYYRWVFLAGMLGSIAAAPVNTFSVFYAKSLGMSMERYGKLLVIGFGVSLVLSYLLGWLADRFHPLRLGLAALAAYALLMFWGGWAATTAESFSIAFVGHVILSGTFQTGTASIGQRLYPKAQFAQFASAAGLVASLGFLIVPPSLGAFLDATGRNYRSTFFLSGGVAIVAVIAFALVIRRFKALGGDRDYVAPR